MSVIRAKVEREADGSLRLTAAEDALWVDTEVALTVVNIPSAEERREAVKELLLLLLPHDTGPWPAGFTCRRAEIYGETGR